MGQKNFCFEPIELGLRVSSAPLAVRSINLTALTRMQKISKGIGSTIGESWGTEFQEFRIRRVGDWRTRDGCLVTPRPKPMLPSLDQTSAKPQHHHVSHGSRRRADKLVTLSRPSRRKFGARTCQLVDRKTLPPHEFAAINVDQNQSEGHNVFLGNPFAHFK